VSLGVLGLQGLVAMAQYFLYFTLPLPVGGVSESAFELIGGELIQRVTGFLGHSNTFAAYLLVPISLGALLLVTRVRVVYRLAALPSLGLGLFALLLTFSRNGLLSLALLVLLVAGLAIATGRLPRATPIAAVGAALIVILLVSGFGLDEVTLRSWGLLGDGAGPGVISAVVTRIAYDPGKAVESRLDLLRIAGAMVRSHPLLGVGLNSFEENMALYDHAGTVHIIQQPVHNIFALVAAETGLPSLCAWLVAGLLLVRRSWRLLWSGGEAAFLAGALGVTSIVVLSFSNLFDLTLRKEPLMGAMTLVAALVVTSSQGSPADVDRRAQTSGR
jgi:O-antigen ligase